MYFEGCRSSGNTFLSRLEFKINGCPGRPHACNIGQLVIISSFQHGRRHIEIINNTRGGIANLTSVIRERVYGGGAKKLH